MVDFYKNNKEGYAELSRAIKTVSLNGGHVFLSKLYIEMREKYGFGSNWVDKVVKELENANLIKRFKDENNQECLKWIDELQ